MAGTSKRGFASMDPQRQKEIASRGGRAAHEKGTAHEFSSDEARKAGRKGGEAVSRDRSYMAMIGRRGGERRSANRKAVAETPQQQTAATRPNVQGPSVSPRRDEREDRPNVTS